MDNVIDITLRSYIASRAGIVGVVECNEDTGEIIVSMSGGCSGYPQSVTTLKLGIEETIKQFIPWVKNVDVWIDEDPPNFGFGPLG